MNSLNKESTVPELIVEALKNALGIKLVAIVLFGSRARGEASMESDRDILVIAHDLPPKTFSRHVWLKGFTYQLPRSLTTIWQRPRQNSKLIFPRFTWTLL